MNDKTKDNEVIISLAEWKEGQSKKQGEGNADEVYIQFSGEAAARLNKLTEQAGLQDRGQAVRNGLRIYEWFLAMQAAGHRILIQRQDEPGTEREVVLDL